MNDKEKFFDEVVRSRRSVRIFDGEKIDASLIERALEHALLAPNSSNLQPWEFYWLRSAEKRAELAAICLGQAGAVTASELLVCVARTKSWKKVLKHQLTELQKLSEAQVKIPGAVWDYYKKIVPMAYDNGFLNFKGIFKKLLFFVIGLKKPIVRGPTSETDLRIWAIKSSALACENFMLSIQASGYHTLPMEGFDEVRMKRFLNLPSDAETVMAIAVGREKVGVKTLPRIRIEKNEIIHYID